MGNHEDLRVGSNAFLTCFAPAALLQYTITWSGPDGTEMGSTSSPTLLLNLSPVDYSKRGTYTCTLTSSQLAVDRTEVVEVTVQGNKKITFL